LTWGLSLALIGSVAPIAGAIQDGPPEPRSVREVRTIYTGDFGIRRPHGVSYLPEAGALLVAGEPGKWTPAIRLTPQEKRLGSLSLPRGDPTTLAYDARNDAVAMLSGETMVTVAAGQAAPRPSPTGGTSLESLGLDEPGGATFDSEGDLLVLDAVDRSIIRVENGDPAKGVSRISLRGLDAARLQGIAYNPSDGLLYVTNPHEDLLFALDGSGMIRESYSLASLELKDIQGIVFAPSADSTDDEATLNLFIADAGDRSTFGGVTEVTLAAAATTDVPVLTAELVQLIDTSAWSPASPDRCGVPRRESLADHPDRNRDRHRDHGPVHERADWPGP
jgi:hypothetical protein